MATDTGVYYAIKKVMDKYDIPDWIWQPIATLESGLNPKAENISKKEYSLGIFQINVAAHPEYTGYNLYDPAENAAAIADLWTKRGVIEQAKKLPAEQQAAYVWRYGSRPAWTPALESKVKSLSKEILSQESSLNLYDDIIQMEIEKLGIPDISSSGKAETEEINLDLKGVILRGLAYGLIFIFIFIALIYMVKPDIFPAEILKGVKSVAK